MKKYIIFSLTFLSLLTVHVYADQIDRFAFITPIQTVVPGEISKPITLQSQNSSGTSVPTTETYDLSVISSSASGTFLSSSGKPLSKVMNKGTASRTFYYKDPSLGDFSITVTATGRDSKKKFVVMQYIFITAIATTTRIQISNAVSHKTEKIIPQEKIQSSKTTSLLVSTTSSETSTSSARVERQTAQVFEAPASHSLVSRVFAWPIKAFDFLRRFFVGD